MIEERGIEFPFLSLNVIYFPFLEFKARRRSFSAIGLFLVSKKFNLVGVVLLIGTLETVEEEETGLVVVVLIALVDVEVAGVD